MKKLLLLVTTVALLAVGCNTNQSAIENTPVTHQSTSNQQAAPQNSGTGRQTYRNDVLGFEVQIPMDWTVETRGSKNELFFYSQATRQVNAAKKAACAANQSACEIAVPEQIDMYFTNNYFSDSTKKQTINGIVWTIDENEVSGWHFTTKHNGKAYTFQLPHLPENNAKIVQFLSTFKFIQ